MAIDIPEQVCITKDNVQVGIDGVLYMQILDAARASYGIANYEFAISQLAQTTLRSQIGKIELDRTFEERATINANVVSELDSTLSNDEFVAKVKANTARWETVANYNIVRNNLKNEILLRLAPIVLGLLAGLVGL